MFVDTASHQSARAATPPEHSLENAEVIRAPTPPGAAGRLGDKQLGSAEQPPQPNSWELPTRRAAPSFAVPSGVRCNNWFGGGDVVGERHLTGQQPSPERQQHASPAGSPERLYPVYAQPRAEVLVAQQQQERLASPAVSEYDEPEVVDTHWPGGYGSSTERSGIICGPLFGNGVRTAAEPQCGLPMRTLAPPQGMRLGIRRHGKWCV